jgi:hypothetical protein
MDPNLNKCVPTNYYKDDKCQLNQYFSLKHNKCMDCHPSCISCNGEGKFRCTLCHEHASVDCVDREMLGEYADVERCDGDGDRCC